METRQRGSAAEAAVLAALVRRGYQLLVPFGDGQPYDLVAHLEGGAFLRIQCKTAWLVKGCLAFNSRSTDHGRGGQPYFGLADVFAVHYPADDSIYLVPLDSGAGLRGRLRIEPARNNQRKGVRLAADFAIDHWTRERLLSLIRVASAIAA